MKITSKIIALGSIILLGACSTQESKKTVIDASTIQVSGEMEADLTSPPNVPASVGNREAKKLIVDMEILEEEGTMTDGVTYIYWTFGGSVPGSFIRTRVGDEVEVLISSSNGLLNYSMGDCIRIASTEPYITFEIIGRVGQGLNIATEKHYKPFT